MLRFGHASCFLYSMYRFTLMSAMLINESQKRVWTPAEGHFNDAVFYQIQSLCQHRISRGDVMGSTGIWKNTYSKKKTTHELRLWSSLPQADVKSSCSSVFCVSCTHIYLYSSLLALSCPGAPVCVWWPLPRSAAFALVANGFSEAERGSLSKWRLRLEVGQRTEIPVWPHASKLQVGSAPHADRRLKCLSSVPHI